MREKWSQNDVEGKVRDVIENDVEGVVSPMHVSGQSSASSSRWPPGLKRNKDKAKRRMSNRLHSDSRRRGGRVWGLDGGLKWRSYGKLVPTKGLVS